MIRFELRLLTRFDGQWGVAVVKAVLVRRAKGDERLRWELVLAEVECMMSDNCENRVKETHRHV